MKVLLAIIIFVHGLIHFMGFAKAYGYGNVTRITQNISKTTGILWLLAAFLFLATGIFYLFKKESWPLIALAAAVLSQVLIMLVWKDARFGTIANVIVLFVAIYCLIK